jgi:hypothetical protein
MVQALCHRSLNAKAQVQLQTSLCGICGRQMGTGTGFLLSISFYRCSKLIRSAVTDAVKSRALTASLSNTYTHIGCGIVHLNTDFFGGRCDTTRAVASSFLRFLDHTQQQSVGLLWTSDQLVAETSTWQHTTLTIDKHPCPRWDSNPRLQQASGRRPKP